MISIEKRLRDYKRWLARQKPEAPRPREEYRGFVIVRGHRDYSLSEGGKLWPVGFASLVKAREAVDRCLALRGALGQESES